MRQNYITGGNIVVLNLKDGGKYLASLEHKLIIGSSSAQSVHFSVIDLREMFFCFLIVTSTPHTEWFPFLLSTALIPCDTDSTLLT